MPLTARTVFRRYEVDGVPDSGNHDVNKDEVVQYLEAQEVRLALGGVNRTTLDLLDSIVPTEGTYPIGTVTADPEVGNNGIYVWTGDAWQKSRSFPDTLARLTSVAGSANAVTAISPVGVVPADVVMLLIEPAVTNTGPVTLSVDGAPPKAVTDVNGEQLSAGLWTAGRLISIVDDGANYRMSSDPDADGSAAAAAASAALAEQWAGVAGGAAVPDDSLTAAKLRSSEMGAIASKMGFNLFIQDIPASSVPTSVRALHPVGFATVDPAASTWKRIAAPSVPRPWHKQSADGQWWAISDHIVHPYMFGNVGKGADDSQAFQDALNFLTSGSPPPAGELIIPAGTYLVSDLLLTKPDTFAYQADIRVRGFGAILRPYLGGSVNGSILRVTDFISPQVTIEGFYVDHTTTHNHQNTIVVTNADNVHLQNLYVGVGGRDHQKVFSFLQGVAGDAGTASYWCVVENCWVRRNGPRVARAAIYSAGENNALDIINNKLTLDRNLAHTTAAILFEKPMTGAGHLANCVLIKRNKIEANDYGVQVFLPNGENAGHGWEISGNRYEAVNISHGFTMDGGGSPGSVAMPAIIGPNSYTGAGGISNTPGVTLINRERS